MENSKIAERMKILHSRIKSILTQIHYMKNTLLNESGYFTKLSLNPCYEQSLKLLNKKFPNVLIDVNKAVLEPLLLKHEQILQELMFHYNTLIDILEARENLLEVLGLINSFHFFLDIRLNTEMTKLCLDLVVDYACIMIILSGITQVRMIIGIYNLAFMSKFGQEDRLYTSLCHLFGDKQRDGYVAELCSEMSPFSRIILVALTSLSTVLPFKTATTYDWEDARIFELRFPESKYCSPVVTKQLNLVTFFSLTQIHRWLFIGYLIVYPEILRTSMTTLHFRAVIDASEYVTLFRDERLLIHPFFLKFCASQKGLSKLAAMVKDSQKTVGQRTAKFHSTRRKFLCPLLRIQLQAIIDSPSIIAPNIATLCQALSFAVDEVRWIVSNPVKPKNRNTNGVSEESFDLDLPELIYLIEEIRYLVKKFDIVTKYYRKTIVLVDLPALQSNIELLSDQLTSTEMRIVLGFVDQIELLKDQPLSAEKYFKGVRLDWLRLQTTLCNRDSMFSWDDNVPFANLLSRMILHTHFVDNLSAFLDKFSSMKFLYFYPICINQLFHSSLTMVTHCRYSIVFPRICAHFLSNCRRDCPEDFNVVLRNSTETALSFIVNICQQLCQHMAFIIKSHYEVSQRSLPREAANLFLIEHFQRKQLTNEKKHRQHLQKEVTEHPGFESRRYSIDFDSSFDTELINLTQLASSLNSRPIVVNNRNFRPNVYLRKEIVRFLGERMVTLVNLKSKKCKHDAVIGIRRPSEMKLLFMESLNTIATISECVNINISLVYMDIFFSQSSPKDSAGRSTLLEMYCNWYLDFVLQQPHVLYSPLMNCFITSNQISTKESCHVEIRCEEYTDIEELRALVEIVGPYGMHSLKERITTLIVKDINALRRFVQRNRNILLQLDALNLDYNKIKVLLHNLLEVDDFCHQWRRIGILFAFKEQCRQAIQHVTKRSMPFLESTVKDLHEDLDVEPIDDSSCALENENLEVNEFKNIMTANDLFQGFGFKTKMDSELIIALEAQKLLQQKIQATEEEDISQSEEVQNELLIVATSYLLPRLVGSNFYRIEYEAIDDNAHCAAYAIKELIYVFFMPFGEERVTIEAKKFIGLCSSNLLRLGIETSAHENINKEEVVLINNIDSIYLFFDFVVRILDTVSDDFYEECFPYALVRHAYQNIVKQSRQVIVNADHPTELSSKSAFEASKNNY